MLDSTEGPHRMRKKTMRNDQFYTQYIYRPELEDPENVSAEFTINLNLVFNFSQENFDFFHAETTKIQSGHEL